MSVPQIVTTIPSIILSKSTFFITVAGPSAFVGSVLRPYYQLGIRIKQNNTVIASFEQPVRAATVNDTLPSGFVVAESAVADFDLSTLLEREKNGHFTFPHTKDNYVIQHNILTNFSIEPYERWGTGTDETTGTSKIINALHATLDDYRLGTLNDMGQTFADKLNNSQMFLTWQPTTVYTDIYTPQRLYFIYLKTQRTLNLTVKQYYSDDTTATNNIGSKTMGLSDATTAPPVFECIVDYSCVRTNPSKKLVKYDVYITNTDGTAVSETRTFVVDYTYQSYARYFMYKNSLGMYETIRTTGEVKKTNQIDILYSSIPLPKGFSSVSRRERAYKSSVDYTYIVNCGYFRNIEEAEYAVEMLSSLDIYWLKNGKAYPVSISKSKNEVSNDGDYNRTASFEISHSLMADIADTSTAQVAVSVPSAFSIDFNTDFEGGKTVGIAGNEEQSQEFTRNNCGIGYNGTSVTYTVPADTYFAGTLQGANALALADIEENGQNYANSHGTCVLSQQIFSYNKTTFTDTDGFTSEISDDTVTSVNGKLQIVGIHSTNEDQNNTIIRRNTGVIQSAEGATITINVAINVVDVPDNCISLAVFELLNDITGETVILTASYENNTLTGTKTFEMGEGMSFNFNKIGIEIMYNNPSPQTVTWQISSMNVEITQA